MFYEWFGERTDVLAAAGHTSDKAEKYDRHRNSDQGIKEHHRAKMPQSLVNIYRVFPWLGPFPTHD